MNGILRHFHRRTSVKTKGMLYVVLLVSLIFLTVSVLVLSTVRNNLVDQLDQFHWSIARKLARTAADILLTKDYAFLMDQIRQLQGAEEVSRVRVLDNRRIIVASDRIGDIGGRDAEMAALLAGRHAPRTVRQGNEEEILMPIEIGGDTLGVLRVGFDWKAEGKRIAGELKRTARQLLYLALVTFLLGTGGAFVVTRILTRPIVELSREIERFDREIYPRDETPGPADCRDESLRVREAFSRMMANLRAYLEKNKKISAERERLSCMAAIGQMSAQIAHEMRNNLYAIRGAVSGLEKSQNAEQRREYLQVVKEEIREMTRMSDDFLQFARTPAPEPVPCDMETVAGRVAELLEPDLEEAGITLERRGERLPPVMADPTLLKRAFMNLFLNAIQAMEQGGRITVEYFRRGGFGAVAIQDDGPGVPEEINVKVFQPFFTTKPTGTGLGLPMVYKLIVAQGGDVELEESTTGARFTMQLPLARQGEPAAGSEEENDGKDPGR